MLYCIKCMYLWPCVCISLCRLVDPRLCVHVHWPPMLPWGLPGNGCRAYISGSQYSQISTIAKWKAEKCCSPITAQWPWCHLCGVLWLVNVPSSQQSCFTPCCCRFCNIPSHFGYSLLIGTCDVLICDLSLPRHILKTTILLATGFNFDVVCCVCYE